jgi:hypothetical protein
MWLRRGSMIVLLVLLLITVFITPSIVSTSSVSGRIVQDVLLSSILLSGIVAASERPKELLLIALFALGAIAIRWMEWLPPAGFTLAIREEATLLALAPLGIVIGMIVFGPGTVTRNRICGAIVLYIMVGVVFAEAYLLVVIYAPGALAGISPRAGPVDRSTLMYFSFTTLTTVGYGDITPVARVARSLSNLEALIGQLYPAIVLARLVSLQAAGSGSGANKS